MMTELLSGIVLDEQAELTLAIYAVPVAGTQNGSSNW